jgi:hypothetical protein
VALWCSTARTGFGFGRSHGGQHAPEDPVAASWPLFARRTGGRSATARRGVQTMTLASAWAVISPCRKGTVAAGSMSDSCGPGCPPRGSLFPADTLRSLFLASARGNQRWMSREEHRTRSCRVPRRRNGDSFGCSCSIAGRANREPSGRLLLEGCSWAGKPRRGSALHSG